MALSLSLSHSLCSGRDRLVVCSWRKRKTKNIISICRDRYNNDDGHFDEFGFMNNSDGRIMMESLTSDKMFPRESDGPVSLFTCNNRSSPDEIS